MKPEAGVKKNFLRFYLDPEQLSMEDAEEALRDSGVDVEKLKEKGERFLKKLEAKTALSSAGKKKEEFLNDLNNFNNEKAHLEGSKSYKLAARKNKNFNEISESDDAKLFEFLKKKNT